MCSAWSLLSLTREVQRDDRPTEGRSARTPWQVPCQCGRLAVTASVSATAVVPSSALCESIKSGILWDYGRAQISSRCWETGSVCFDTHAHAHLLLHDLLMPLRGACACWAAWPAVAPQEGPAS